MPRWAEVVPCQGSRKALPLILDDVVIVTAGGPLPGRVVVRHGRLGLVRGVTRRPGALVFPGLVNAHDHLHLNVFPRLRFRPVYDNSARWAVDMAPRLAVEPLRTFRRLPLAARAWHGAVKNALAGVATVVHHDPWLAAFAEAGFPVTVPPAGWAHSVALGAPGDTASPVAYGPDPRSSHAATPPCRPWFIHVAEGTDEAAARDLGVLEDWGCLGPMTRLVHGVGLSAADVDLARRRGAALVWCPGSNLFLVGRVADPAPFVPGRLLLGTDARLTGSRDLLQELALGRRHGADPDALLAAVTTDGRRLCGLAEAGPPEDWPDFLVVAADPEDLQRPAAALCRAARIDLRLVVHRGRPVIADPDLSSAFAATEVPWMRCRLDGRAKVIADSLVTPLEAAGIRETGLEVAWPEGHDFGPDPVPGSLDT